MGIFLAFVVAIISVITVMIYYKKENHNMHEMDLKLFQLRYKINYLDIISYVLSIYLFETFKK